MPEDALIYNQFKKFSDLFFSKEKGFWGMEKRAANLFWGMLFIILWTCQSVCAASVPRQMTPDYKVAFYEFNCYHMQDENGRKTGYGYEMMQDIAEYLQCTFSYVGYESTAKDCEEMLRKGTLDLYTAAKKTPEREKEFAFSVHTAITAVTCLNTKMGNETIIPGDYETYDGMKVGLLKRHTYNEEFLGFAEEKGFYCQVVYYETPAALADALVSGEVDAVQNSYVHTPEDEKQLETFGETPYYIMARKEDQDLIDRIDKAIDCLNAESPDWRMELYSKYYGTESLNAAFTDQEQDLLEEMRADHVVIRAVMKPDVRPYSWYEKGKAYGIVPDIFREIVQELGLDCEIIPVQNRKEYQEVLESGEADIWLDLYGYQEEEGKTRYKITEPYLTTTASIVRDRDALEKIEKLAVEEESVLVREIVSSVWPSKKIHLVKSDILKQSETLVLNGEVDGALVLTYTAQNLVRENIQNHLRSDIVPGVLVEMRMGVNAQIDWRFYELWQKALSKVTKDISSKIQEAYLEEMTEPSILAYLCDHPGYLTVLLVGILLILFLAFMYVYSAKSKMQQQKIAGELAKALEEAKKANEVKQNFFSKMSHDIRTPLNVVLGMTQVAQKYQQDPARQEKALNSIEAAGNYLLVLVNSILDMNQLEHGTVELLQEPFRPAVCVKKVWNF